MSDYDETPDEPTPEEKCARLRAELARVTGRLAMAEETLNDAHFLLCFNHQDCVETDPPKDQSGCCYWRVWHLGPHVYDRMTSAEQSLYTMLMRYEHAEQERRALMEKDTSHE